MSNFVQFLQAPASPAATVILILVLLGIAGSLELSMPEQPAKHAINSETK